MDEVETRHEMNEVVKAARDMAAAFDKAKMVYDPLGNLLPGWDEDVLANEIKEASNALATALDNLPDEDAHA